MEINKIFTENKPYIVMAEDVWDYYKEPPIRTKLFESDNYLNALAFAIDYYDGCDLTELNYPWITSLWITPEPSGIHFDYNKHVEYQKQLKSSQSINQKQP